MQKEDLPRNPKRIIKERWATTFTLLGMYGIVLTTITVIVYNFIKNF